MNGITENSQPGDARRQGSRLEGKDLIGYNSHLIGNKDLFPEPYDKPFHAFSEILKPDISMYYLGGDIVESNNRPGDQLREQGNIESFKFERKKTFCGVPRIFVIYFNYSEFSIESLSI